MSESDYPRVSSVTICFDGSFAMFFMAFDFFSDSLVTTFTFPLNVIVCRTKTQKSLIQTRAWLPSREGHNLWTCKGKTNPKSCFVDKHSVVDSETSVENANGSSSEGQDTNTRHMFTHQVKVFLFSSM